MFDLITRQSILFDLHVNSKAEALQEIGEHAAKLNRLPPALVQQALLERERLGSTGIGRGLGVPHAQIVGLTRPAGVFARLHRPIPFDAIDNRPVDLIFALLIPAQTGPEPLKALAAVARVLRDETMAKTLRSAADAQALYVLLAHRISCGHSLLAS